MHPGMVGGLIGAVVGIAGGLFGTYCSITHTQGPKERAFMVRCAWIVWTAVLGFVALVVLLPRPYNLLLWIPYAVAVPLGIRAINRRQRQIQDAERHR